MLFRAGRREVEEEEQACAETESQKKKIKMFINPKPYTVQ